METALRFFFLLVLILISVFLSLSEIALASSRKIKLQILSEENIKAADDILAMQKDSGDFFAAVQIGINAVAILGGIIGDKILNPFVSSFIKNNFPRFMKDSESIGSFISFIIVTALFIEFADLIPKRIAMVYPEKIALKTIGPMRIIITLTKPLIWFFNAVADLVLKIMKIDKTRVEIVTYDDIFAIVDAGAEAGVVQKKEHSLIENVFELDTRWVSSIMTTRDEIAYLTMQDDQETIKTKIMQAPHTKFLICNTELDEIIGYINSKDILARILDGDLNCLEEVRDNFTKNLLIIPNTITLSETLDRFNEAKDDFAVILNEYSNVMGLVTMKDVVNTLMGDVVFQNVEDQQIIVRDENSWLIEGTAAMEDVKKALDDIEEFPEEDSYETIAGFVIFLVKAIPKKGTKVEYEGFSFEVVTLDKYKIDQILVTRLKKVDTKEKSLEEKSKNKKDKRVEKDD